MPPRKRKKKASKGSAQNQSLTPLTSSLEDSSRFLELPLEIRQRIYTAYFQLEHPPSTSQAGSYQDLMHLTGSEAILYTSRQVHMEVWPIYTEYRVFAFTDPMKMANNFLSFLPRQRLHSVKHLRLFNIHWIVSLWIRDFERIWWYYLDVFTRLDTLVFAEYSQDAPSTIHTILPVITGLLQQGAPSRPKWVNKKHHNALVKSNELLPLSFDWEIQLSVTNFWEDSPYTTNLSARRDRGNYGELILRKGNGVLQHVGALVHPMLRTLGIYHGGSRIWKHDLRLNTDRDELLYRSRDPTPSIWSSPTDKKIKLGASIRCLNDFTNLSAPVDFIRIGGRWVNNSRS